jgi:hypothetical protein
MFSSYDSTNAKLFKKKKEEEEEIIIYVIEYNHC